MIDHATAVHEAAHAVGGLLAGYRVTMKAGPSKDRPTALAVTTIEPFVERDDFGHLVACLMGPMAEGKSGPGWPPLPDLLGHDDEHVAANLVAYGGLDRQEFAIARSCAYEWLTTPHVQFAIRQLAKAFEERGELCHREVRAAIMPEVLEWIEGEGVTA